MTDAERIAALEALVSKLVGAQPAPVVVDDTDWNAIDLAVLRVQDPTAAGLFGRHKYDIVEGRRVVTIYDAEYGEALERSGCFPFIALRTKRREIAALLRDGGMQSAPQWWSRVLVPVVHNAGIQTELAKLERAAIVLRSLIV